MCTTAVTAQRVIQCILQRAMNEMIRIGVRCDSRIELPDVRRRIPRIPVCQLRPSETIEDLDICFNNSQRVEMGSIRQSI